MTDRTQELYDLIRDAHGQRAADRCLAAEQAKGQPPVPAPQPTTPPRRPAKAPPRPEPVPDAPTVPPAADRAAARRYEPDGDPVTLALPLPDARANARMHWRVRYAADVRIKAACDQWPNPPAPRRPWAAVYLTFHVQHGGNAMDWDNLGARIKPLQDWLVRAGYLAGDGPAVIRRRPDISQRHRTPSQLRRVLVTIQPLREVPCDAS